LYNSGVRARSVAVERTAFALIPALFTAIAAAYVVRRGLGAIDFHLSFRVAGYRLLHGRSLYAWTTPQVAHGVSFPYPAPAAFLFAPFTALPNGVGSALITGVCMVAAPLSLWAVDVRDRRLYGYVMLLAPVVVGWQTANLSLPIAAGVALCWRLRERRDAAATLIATLICVKPIMAPLALWLLASRRYGATIRMIAWVLAINVVGWTVVGFGAIGDWLHLLSRQGNLLYGKGYGVIATATHAGLTRSEGTVALVLLSAALAAACFRLAWTGRDGPAFATAVLLTIVVSPQVDLHYFALLLVPVAIARPALSGAWIVPLVLWACPAADANAPQEWIWWIVLIALGAMLLRTPSMQRATTS
jgi:hypothetical protein